MTNITNPPNPEDADKLLTELFTEVQNLQATRSGGETLTPEAAAINNLLQTKINFGNPKDKLILLTEELFQEIGVELNGIYRQQMAHTFDFYYMTVTVNLRPQPGTKFWRLCCQLDFSPKGAQEPIVQTIFPKSKWRSLMNRGVGMNLALNENLEWSLGVDASQLAEIANLPGELKANVTSKNELKAFVVVPDYTYEGGRFEIIAQGEGDSNCYWRIEEPEIQKIPTVQFAIVFKVPKATELINLQGICWAEPNINWLYEDVKDVFSELGDKFKNIFRQKDKAATQFARSVGEKWELKLPR
jgi:hypothetical protein